MEEIIKIWVQMGIGSTRRYQRVEEIHDLIKKAMDNSLKTEQNSLDELIEYRTAKLEEINQLLTDLSMDAFNLPEDFSLLQAARALHQKFNSLKLLKDERMSKLDELKTKCLKLCSQLGIEMKPLNFRTNIPSELEIMHLQGYMTDLSKEKTKRLNRFQSIRNHIKKLFVLLELEPVDDFERQLIFGETEHFKLSEGNMKNLQSLHEKLENEYEVNKKLHKELEAKLISLYERLDVPDYERDIFLAENNDCRPSTLKMLQSEIKKKEEIKLQNLAKFICKVRDELKEWYEICYSSDDEKLLFQQYFESDHFTEDLLDIHEQELARLQKYYQENQSLFTKFAKWQNVWTRYQDLEIKANDPQRFNNRGGTLLKEETERRNIQKNLPKLEKELRDLSKQMVLEGKPAFSVKGVEVGEYLAHQWQEYKEMKENEKKKRQIQKQKETQVNLKGKTTPGGGNAVVRRTPLKRSNSTVSPCSGGKIRKFGGPLTPSKINENNGTLNQGGVVPVAIPRTKRNLNNEMNQVCSVNGSMLSLNEDEFQVRLKIMI